MEKVMVVGDVHRDFSQLNNLIIEHKPDVVIVLGDFGYVCPYALHELPKLMTSRTKIYFIDGNHDNHFLLGLLFEANGRKLTPVEIQENIYWLPRGTTMELNGENILFMGGAESPSFYQGTLGYNWWREESITMDDIRRVPKEKIDTIMSHTAPDFIIRYIGGEGDSQSEILLRSLYGRIKPKNWYFGHMHRVCNKKTGGVQFHGLNQIPNKGCWCWLGEK